MMKSNLHVNIAVIAKFQQLNNDHKCHHTGCVILLGLDEWYIQLISAIHTLTNLMTANTRARESSFLYLIPNSNLTDNFATSPKPHGCHGPYSAAPFYKIFLLDHHTISGARYNADRRLHEPISRLTPLPSFD